MRVQGSVCSSPQSSSAVLSHPQQSSVILCSPQSSSAVLSHPQQSSVILSRSLSSSAGLCSLQQCSCRPETEEESILQILQQSHQNLSSATRAEVSMRNFDCSFTSVLWFTAAASLPVSESSKADAASTLHFCFCFYFGFFLLSCCLSPFSILLTHTNTPVCFSPAALQ